MNKLPKYDNPKYNKFVKEITDAGFGEHLCHYEGRYFYKGPGCATSRENNFTEQDIIRATTMKLTKDDLGLDIILYPQ